VRQDAACHPTHGQAETRSPESTLLHVTIHRDAPLEASNISECERPAAIERRHGHPQRSIGEGSDGSHDLAAFDGRDTDDLAYQSRTVSTLRERRGRRPHDQQDKRKREQTWDGHVDSGLSIVPVVARLASPYHRPPHGSRTEDHGSTPSAVELSVTPVVWGIVAYILAQLAVGVAVSKRIRTESDYLVAGRSLGPVLAAFSVFATWFGAETCIGAAGAVYEYGLAGGSADPFGYALCVILAGLIFAVPLWRLRLTTLADVFRLRFDVSVERLAVLLMVPASLFWAAAQIRAFGQVLASASGFEVDAMITFATIVVIAYTMFGGLLADAWTDVFQGIALIIGLAVLIWRVFAAEGLAPLTELGPSAFNPLGIEPRPFLAIVEEWAVPVIGSMIAAELVTRMLGSRSASIARNAAVFGGTAYLAIGLMPVMLGLIGATLLPGLEEPEQILPALAQSYLPTVLYVLFAGGLVAAILSTVDSALLAASSLVSHNVIVQMRPGLSERAKLRLARGGVAVFGLIAYAMALGAERVYELVESSSSFGSAGIVTVVTFGLFTRIGGPGSALAALISGVGTWIAGAYLLVIPYPYLTSLAVAVGAYLLAAALGSTPTRVLEPQAA